MFLGSGYSSSSLGNREGRLIRQKVGDHGKYLCWELEKRRKPLCSVSVSLLKGYTASKPQVYTAQVSLYGSRNYHHQGGVFQHRAEEFQC